MRLSLTVRQKNKGENEVGRSEEGESNGRNVVIYNIMDIEGWEYCDFLLALSLFIISGTFLSSLSGTSA